MSITKVSILILMDSLFLLTKIKSYKISCISIQFPLYLVLFIFPPSLFCLSFIYNYPNFICSGTAIVCALVITPSTAEIPDTHRP